MGRLARPRLLASWLGGAAELGLLAAPARLTWASRNLRPWPARVAELTEDLAQPVVHSLKYGRPVGQVHVLKRGEPLDGRVDPGVTGGGESRPNSFWIHGVSISSAPLVTRTLARYATLPRERYRATRSEAHMHSAEECRTALQKLAGRLSELSPAERDQYFGNRTMSVAIPDLGVTFVTRLGSGDDPVREAAPGEPAADIRLTAKSDEVVALAEQPMNIARAWMSGRIKIEASVKDLFRLRRLL
jgi:hypothetical protein